MKRRTMKCKGVLFFLVIIGCAVDVEEPPPEPCVLSFDPVGPEAEDETFDPTTTSTGRWLPADVLGEGTVNIHAESQTITFRRPGLDCSFTFRLAYAEENLMIYGAVPYRCSGTGDLVGGMLAVTRDGDVHAVMQLRNRSGDATLEFISACVD